MEQKKQRSQLFVPFEIEKNEIADLSYMLSDGSALRALFNTNGKVDSEKQNTRQSFVMTTEL